jgi:hypothetical protein
VRLLGQVLCAGCWGVTVVLPYKRGMLECPSGIVTWCQQACNVPPGWSYGNAERRLHWPCALHVQHAETAVVCNRSIRAPGAYTKCVVVATPALDGECSPAGSQLAPSSDTAPQILALMALRAKDVIIARNLATIRANLALARQLVEDMPQLLEWQEPKAGSVAFPRIKACADVEAFCEGLVAEAGILLLPATVYDHPGAVARGHFRLGLGRADFAEKLQLLRQHLEGKYGKGSSSSAGL